MFRDRLHSGALLLLLPTLLGLAGNAEAGGNKRKATQAEPSMRFTFNPFRRGKQRIGVRNPGAAKTARDASTILLTSKLGEATRTVVPTNLKATIEPVDGPIERIRILADYDPQGGGIIGNSIFRTGTAVEVKYRDGRRQHWREFDGVTHRKQAVAHANALLQSAATSAQ